MLGKDVQDLIEKKAIMGFREESLENSELNFMEPTEEELQEMERTLMIVLRDDTGKVRYKVQCEHVDHPWGYTLLSLTGDGIIKGE